jgi:hypothetical protein
MFSEDLIISGIRLQAGRLQDVLKQIEQDKSWRKNFSFYTRRLNEVEKSLRKIRNYDFRNVAEIFN